jgi:hypothetical protein
MIGRYESLLTEEFIDEIELLKWCNGIEYFKVVCSKANEMLCVNIVRGISIGTEDDILYFDDDDDVLLTNNCIYGLSPISKIEIIKTSTYEYFVNHRDFSIKITGLNNSD